MQTSDYPNGKGGIKAKYESGQLVFRNASGTELYRINPSTGQVTAAKLHSGAGSVAYTQRFRATAAEVNAGLTLLPALPGFKYRIVDMTMIAIGGNAATATSVDIVGTRGASEVRPYVVAVAALTRSAIVKPNSANVTALADGASHTPLDANTAVSVSKQSGGSNLATATHVDVILTYTVEAA